MLESARHVRPRRYATGAVAGGLTPLARAAARGAPGGRRDRGPARPDAAHRRPFRRPARAPTARPVVTLNLAVAVAMVDGPRPVSTCSPRSAPTTTWAGTAASPMSAPSRSAPGRHGRRSKGLPGCGPGDHEPPGAALPAGAGLPRSATAPSTGEAVESPATASASFMSAHTTTCVVCADPASPPSPASRGRVSGSVEPGSRPRARAGRRPDRDGTLRRPAGVACRPRCRRDAGTAGPERPGRRRCRQVVG